MRAAGLPVERGSNAVDVDAVGLQRHRAPPRRQPAQGDQAAIVGRILDHRRAAGGGEQVLDQDAHALAANR